MAFITITLRYTRNFLGLLFMASLIFYTTLLPVDSQSLSDQSNLKIGTIRANVRMGSSDNVFTIRWTERRMTHVQTLTLTPGWTVWSSEQRVAYLLS